MSNTLYLDETLTGFEREIAIESAKTDIVFQKLDALYEAVDATLKANYMEAELRVYAENGTYDDLTTLYTEAESEAAKKKGGILSSLFNAIESFCSSIINGIKNIFKKSSENTSVPKDTVLDVATEDIKKLDTADKIVSKATGFLHGIKSTTKDSCEDFVKFVKDNIGFVVVTGTAVVGTTHVITKKVTKASFEKKIAKVTEELDDLKSQGAIAKRIFNDGFIDDAEEMVFSLFDTSYCNQGFEEWKAKRDCKKKEKGSKILDAIKTALRWICDAIKKIGTFVSGIWNKYIGSLFKKNKNTEAK